MKKIIDEIAARNKLRKLRQTINRFAGMSGTTKRQHSAIKDIDTLLRIIKRLTKGF